jgi:hypothetical protein
MRIVIQSCPSGTESNGVALQSEHYAIKAESFHPAML